MKKFLMMTLCVLAMCAMSRPSLAEQFDTSGADKLGFKLCLQAWTNNKKTLYETLELAQQIGVHYVEMYPGQPLGGDLKGKTGPGMSDEEIAKTLEKAKSCDVTLITCGVMGIPSDEAGARATFDWAKKMGLKYINSEPDPKAFEMIDKIAGEYGIMVGIHDHPKPSRYWNPEYAYSLTKPCKNIGLCADTGHWKRSGMNPVDVVNTYGDDIVDSHFKDLVPGGGSANLHDVIWGTGESNAAGVLAALKAKGFKGPLSIEYEWKWEVEDLRKCAEFFYAECNKLAKE